MTVKNHVCIRVLATVLVHVVGQLWEAFPETGVDRVPEQLVKIVAEDVKILVRQVVGIRAEAVVRVLVIVAVKGHVKIHVQVNATKDAREPAKNIVKELVRVDVLGLVHLLALGWFIIIFNVR